MLEQSRPVRAKALKSVMDNVIAVVFHVCFYVNNSFCSHVQLTKGAYFLKKEHDALFIKDLRREK